MFGRLLRALSLLPTAAAAARGRVGLNLPAIPSTAPRIKHRQDGVNSHGNVPTGGTIHRDRDPPNHPRHTLTITLTNTDIGYKTGLIFKRTRFYSTYLQ